MSGINFSRQIAYLGKKSQEELGSATITIIGVGGLGSVCAHLLARMGVGHLILCDADIVSDHNLARQHLYTLSDIRKLKTEAAKQKIQELNSTIRVDTLNDFLTTETIHVFQNQTKTSTLLLDCTDNHEVRRLIEQLAIINSVPWIHGAAIGDVGSVIYFNPADTTLAMYDDIYKEKVDTSCELTGVLATTTTMIATVQTRLALDVIIKKPITQTLLRYDGLTQTIHSYPIKHTTQR